MKRNFMSFTALVAADCLFLWMFFAADKVAASTGEARVAAEWRHGMAGGWPFYMPGFFGLTLAIAWWWRGRTWRRRVIEWTAAFAIAGGVAVMLMPLGVALMLNLLSEPAATVEMATTDAAPWSILFRGAFTVAAWSWFIGLGLHAIDRRRPIALVGALPSFLALHIARSGEAGSLVHAWFERSRTGDPAAWLTLILVPLTGWAVFEIARREATGTYPASSRAANVRGDREASIPSIREGTGVSGGEPRGDVRGPASARR
jgi:hypothetical protein